jgi:RsiW-degrading membrane proteinase PrsW (M82 family)
MYNEAMIVLLHVISAFAGIGFTAYAYFRPSLQRLRISSALIVTTLLSGTVLVLVAHAPLLTSCAAGLAYTAIVANGIFLGRYKLAHAKSSSGKSLQD